jgi:hypothetical protein
MNNRELQLICPNPLVAHNTNGDIMLTTKCTSVQRASVRQAETVDPHQRLESKTCGEALFSDSGASALDLGKIPE